MIHDFILGGGIGIIVGVVLGVCIMAWLIGCAIMQSFRW